jgi:hypothetical protein
MRDDDGNAIRLLAIIAENHRFHASFIVAFQDGIWRCGLGRLGDLQPIGATNNTPALVAGGSLLQAVKKVSPDAPDARCILARPEAILLGLLDCEPVR